MDYFNKLITQNTTLQHFRDNVFNITLYRLLHPLKLSYSLNSDGTDMGYMRCGNWPQCGLIDDVCNAARDGTESPCKNGWFPDGSSQLCGETSQ